MARRTVVETLTKLIEAGVHGEGVFRQCASETDNATLRLYFEAFADQCVEQVMRWTDELSVLGIEVRFVALRPCEDARQPGRSFVDEADDCDSAAMDAAESTDSAASAPTVTYH